MLSVKLKNLLKKKKKRKILNVLIVVKNYDNNFFSYSAVNTVDTYLCVTFNVIIINYLCKNIIDLF